jgi:hypothetical protein
MKNTQSKKQNESNKTHKQQNNTQFTHYYTVYLKLINLCNDNDKSLKS